MTAFLAAVDRIGALATEVRVIAHHIRAHLPADPPTLLECRRLRARIAFLDCAAAELEKMAAMPSPVRLSGDATGEDGAA